jgi:hypothetical protein
VRRVSALDEEYELLTKQPLREMRNGTVLEDGAVVRRRKRTDVACSNGVLRFALPIHWQ